MTALPESSETTPPPAGDDAPTPPPPPRRSPGHRGQDVRDTVAELAARAHEISLEAGSKMSAALKDVINAAAGITAFAIESARDLVQYMVRRGQMTQEEADKLIREVEAANLKRGIKPAPKNDVVKKPASPPPPSFATRPAAPPPAAPAKPVQAKAPPAKAAAAKAKPAAAAKKPAAKKPAAKPAKKPTQKK